MTDDISIKDHIRQIPDFPKPGILFYDISTLLAHAAAWRATVDQLAEAIRPHRPDLLVGIESRGFLVAAPLAFELGCGFVMVRKKGKLPGADHPATSYDLEYGTDTVEIQADAIRPGQRVVVLDDLLATGGTMQAAIALLQQGRRRGGCRRLHHRARLPRGPRAARRAVHQRRLLRPVTVRFRLLAMRDGGAELLHRANGGAARPAGSRKPAGEPPRRIRRRRYR